MLSRKDWTSIARSTALRWTLITSDQPTGLSGLMSSCQARAEDNGKGTGNKYKLINHRFHYDLRKYYFSARIVMVALCNRADHNIFIL